MSLTSHSVGRKSTLRSHLPTTVELFAPVFSGCPDTYLGLGEPLISPASHGAVHSVQEKTLYLLDDPLAAVDADVANHLLHRCILGMLGHTTRLLCTHRTEYLERADLVLLMEAGHLVQAGDVVEETLGQIVSHAEQILPPLHM